MPEADLEPDAESPGGSPFAEQLRIPQFGILHLMIWCAVTAVLLKYFLAMQDLEFLRNSPSPRHYWTMRVIQAIHAITSATILVGAGVLLRARSYRMLRSLQPGHWIVLTSAIGTLVGLLTSPIYLILSASRSQTLWVYALLEAIAITPTVAGWTLAIFKLRDAMRWKLFIVAKALVEALAVSLALVVVATAFLAPNLQWQFFGGLQWLEYSQGIILIFLVVNAIADLSCRISRDWVHWLGIGVLTLTSVISLAWNVYYSFFYHP